MDTAKQERRERCRRAIRELPKASEVYARFVLRKKIRNPIAYDKLLELEADAKSLAAATDGGVSALDAKAIERAQAIRKDAVRVVVHLLAASTAHVTGGDWNVERHFAAAVGIERAYGRPISSAKTADILGIAIELSA